MTHIPVITATTPPATTADIVAHLDSPQLVAHVRLCLATLTARGVGLHPELVDEIDEALIEAIARKPGGLDAAQRSGALDMTGTLSDPVAAARAAARNDNAAHAHPNAMVPA